MAAIDGDSELEQLQELLLASMREAGELALSCLRAPLTTWHKANGSPVSNADIAVDRLLFARLSAAADYGWVSEESPRQYPRLSSRRWWIVDPIDGTRAYIAGRPDWTVAAALVEDERPILGAVYAPIEQALFVAAQGRGATRNGVPIRATSGATLERAEVAGPHRQLEQLAALAPGLRPAAKIYSVALRLARIAEGALDVALISRSARDWDLAAADVLVHEAGAILTALGGERLAYNRAEPVHGSLIAAGRERHGRLIELINQRAAQFA